MDPLRGVIHLGLRMTQTTLDRALDIVKLADSLLVASAVPPVPEPTSQEPVWPHEEQADLDALSATLRARKDPEAPAETATSTPAASAGKSTAKTSASARTSTAKKSTPAKKSTAAKKAAPAKKSTAKKATPAKRSTTKKSASTKAPATKNSTRTSVAKKTVAAETPTLPVLPDA